MESNKDTVYKFMKIANRPFSVNDVFSSLQREGVGKSAVEKALDQLVKENKIFMKLNGKQKIYCLIQPDSATAEDQKEIQSIDEEMLETNLVLRQVEDKFKESEVELKMLRGSISTEEAKIKVIEIEKAVAELKSKLDKLSSKNVGSNLSEKEKEQVKKDYEKVTKEYRKRKRLCMDILDSILENYPKPKKALFEDIGIETDESVNMPSL